MKRTLQKSKRRTQQERSATTQRQLLDAAVECIAELGLASATVPNIVKKAGLTTGAVQHHFGSRDDLLVAVVYAFAERISNRGRPPGLDALSLQNRISIICRDLWDAFGSAEYIAVTEILLGLRSQKDIFPNIQTLMQNAERDLDKYWMEAFANSGVRASKLATARHLFQAAFRGLALRGAYKSSTESWAPERRLLEELIGAFLGVERK